MKSFKILFTFAFVLCFGMSYGQLTVDADNEVGIGIATPSEKLELVDLNENTPSFLVRATFSDGSTASFVKAAAGTNGSAFLYDQNNLFAVAPTASSTNSGPSNFTDLFVVRGSGAQVGIGTLNPTERLEVGGNIKASGMVTQSDMRLKRDISTFKGGLAEVMALNPVQFTYNGKGGTVDGSTHIGLLAQNLQEVAPELVKEYEHVIVESFDLKEGMKTNGTETYLEIKDSEIKYLLLNAIKQQQTQIEALQKEIEALKK